MLILFLSLTHPASLQGGGEAEAYCKGADGLPLRDPYQHRPRVARSPGAAHLAQGVQLREGGRGQDQGHPAPQAWLPAWSPADPQDQCEQGGQGAGQEADL